MNEIRYPKTFTYRRNPQRALRHHFINTGYKAKHCVPQK